MTILKEKINNLFKSKSGEHDGDFILMIAVGIILLFGIIMLSSATTAIAYLKYKGDSYYFFKHQLYGFSLGLIFFFIFSKIDYRKWRKNAFYLLLISIFLLLLVFIPGLSAKWGTSRSWINIFGFSLQPSELVKISFLLYLAAWLDRFGSKISNFTATIPFLAVFVVISLLMLLQPDFGTLFIIALTSLIIYYVSGGKLKHILVIILIGIIGIFIMIRFKPYQAYRFKCFTDPGFSQENYCYQVNQSLIAIGSGGFWGRGLGNSRQKFMYLPEVNSDAIFPIIGEEVGFIFSVILVGFYVFIFYRGYLIAKSAPDNYGRILALGIVSWISLQAMINIGGMVNIMPMTGVPLPLISYGGSSILASLSALGILINISKQTR